MRIIRRQKSVIPACDVPLPLFKKLLRETADIDAIGAYKIGFLLGLGYGLPRVVEIARKYTEKPLIYDHQKAGTDIPDTGKLFAKTVKQAGIDAIILLPQAGPETGRAWIDAAMEEDLGVIVGGLMTHQKYLCSEGGYIADEAILDMYLTASEAGVCNFVVPGNRPEEIQRIRKALEANGFPPTFYAPGFITQGGSISDAANVAGDCWHAIVGRALYEADDIREAALRLSKQLYKARCCGDSSTKKKLF